MKKIFLILLFAFIFSGNAYAKKLVKVIYQDDQSIVFKSKLGLFSDNNEKWNKRVNQIMSISETHCNTVNKDAYWFRGLTSGQGGVKADEDSLDKDGSKLTYVMYRVICANSINEAIKNFRRKIPKYNSVLSYKPNSVYKNDISNWSSDIKLKSSDFTDKKNEEKKSIVKKNTKKKDPPKKTKTLGGPRENAERVAALSFYRIECGHLTSKGKTMLSAQKSNMDQSVYRATQRNLSDLVIVEGIDKTCNMLFGVLKPQSLVQ